ncbi:hypothetical protein RHMOL_Rhmol01G0375400 [Rhododendron molle]|uniref:Uncharacterized protein n=1 Tax=Rhododendron molle TaxID=49168 RepID=A0ACC0QCL3_RHOML|nr:hypothetical protein RHMOL_Rhmol01G0375400 [Rhododendron molle]
MADVPPSNLTTVLADIQRNIAIMQQRADRADTSTATLCALIEERLPQAAAGRARGVKGRSWGFMQLVDPMGIMRGTKWMEDQQKSEGVTPGEDVYIILRLDGPVRRSGKGMPDWQQIVKELPPMEALLSKL